MICNNCKNELEPNSAFCSYCGAKVSAPEASEAPAVPEIKDAVAPEIKAPVQEAPIASQVQPPVREAMPLPVPPVNIAPPPPPVPYREKKVKKVKPEKEPTFFGKGALIACLIVIGILSCSTTVFATLFFTLLGRI